MSNNKQSSPSVLKTAFKFIAILLIFYGFLNFILPDFSEIENYSSSKIRKLADNLEAPHNRFYLLGLINNPEAFYKSSEVHESRNKIDKAIRDIELAIGLLEMNGANSNVIERYQQRLSGLKKKLKNNNPT